MQERLQLRISQTRRRTAPLCCCLSLRRTWGSRLPARPSPTLRRRRTSSMAAPRRCGSASFNVFAPAISSGFNVALGPNGHVSQPVAIDPAQWAKTPAKGLMIVVEDNHSGAPQAELLPVGGKFSLGGSGGQNNGQGQSGQGHGGN